MKPPDLTHTAQRASERYAAVLFGFDGAWGRAASFEDPLAPKTKRDLINRAAGIARAFLETEHRIIADEILDVALRARSDALGELSRPTTADELPTRITKHLNASGAHLKRELAIQLERDIEALVMALKKRILEVDLIVASKAISRDDAIVRTRIAANGPNFMFKDRAGRRSSSRKYARAVWRQALLIARIETKLMTYADFGVTEARVAHPNPNHGFHNLAFNLVGGEVSYMGIRDDVFHPNSEVDVLPH